MNSLFSRALIALALLGALTTSLAAASEDQNLETFFRRYLDENFKLRPTQATGLGDHRFDSQLDDVSPQARAAWMEHTRSTLRDLPKQIDYSKLSRSGQ